MGVVSYPDPTVRNDDHRLQYDITYRGCHTVSDDHRYVQLGLGTRLVWGGGGGGSKAKALQACLISITAARWNGASKK